MNAWRRWWATGGLVLALVAGNATWADPDGDELGGGEKEPAGGENPPPEKPDELGGDDKPSDSGGDGTGRVNDELGGGEPKEAPKDPPKEEPAKPPPVDPPAEPPAEPEPDSVDAEIAAQAALKKEADRVKLLVQKFNQDMKKATAEEQMRLLTAISSTKHPHVALAMIPWIQPEVEDVVRDLAIEVAKGQRSPEIASEAAKLFDKNVTKLNYARSMIGILGRSKDVKQVTKLRAIMKGKEFIVDLQREAIIALGQIGHRDAIPDLIKLYKEFENPRLPEKEVPRKKALEKHVEECLDLITGTHMPNGKGWDLWWRDNEKSFQRPPSGGQPPK